MASLFGGPPNPYSTQRAPGGRPPKLSGVVNSGSIHPGGTGIPYGTVGIPNLPPAPRVGHETMPGSTRLPFPKGATGVPGGDIHLHGTRVPGAPTLAGGATPSAPGAAAPTYPSPLDSTYFEQLNNATLAATNKIDDSNLQSAYGRVDLQNALDQLGYQQGLQTRQAQEAENSHGGYAQGHLGDTLGQLNRSFLDQRASAQQTQERGEAAQSAARSAISQGLTLEQAALAAAAADRASALAAHNPAVGQSGPSLTPAPAAHPAAAPPATQHPGVRNTGKPHSFVSDSAVAALRNALLKGAVSRHPARKA